MVVIHDEDNWAVGGHYAVAPGPSPEPCRLNLLAAGFFQITSPFPLDWFHAVKKS
jgi:hypothetical protein